MTREDLLERFDHHEAFIDKEMPFVNEQVALAEDDGGWVAPGATPKAPTTRDERRHMREALSNEAESRLQLMAEACKLGRQAIDDGDGARALFYDHQAIQQRGLVEPIVADLRNRAARKADGAKSSGNSCKPRKK